MDVDTILARAHAGLGHNTRYDSPGVVPSLGASVWPPSGAHTDCTGFMSWCVRLPRQLDIPFYKRINGGWFETTAIYQDGLSSVGIFRRLTAAKPGAFLVYPDYRGTDGKNHHGHIGMVTEVNGGEGIAGVKTIIHCSLSGWNDFGDAIRATPPDPWKAHSNSIIVWLDDVVDDGAVA